MTTPIGLTARDLGRMGYGPALEEQRLAHESVLAGGPGVLLLVEHEPVITLSQRRGASSHLLASSSALERMGIEVHQTDRGGDITYHGPGQLVVYPILRLSDHGLNVGRYMRLLEQAVIDASSAWGVEGFRDPPNTGVWVATERAPGAGPAGASADAMDTARPAAGGGRGLAKLCAFGVRVRRNVTMHGLALNVTTDLSHFAAIVPCGLPRPVTSLSALLGQRCPSMEEVKRRLVGELTRLLDAPAVTEPGR